MRSLGSLGAAGALLATAGVGFGVIIERSAARADPRAVIERYCVDCHNSAERAGDLALDRVPLGDVHAAVETWERVVRKVRTGFMPPAGEPRPPRAALDAFAAALEDRLDAAARSAPHAGFKGVSRLNRAEYANAVRDLLGYDASAVVATLPADDAIQGFDNVAAALTVSPTLIEGYVTAAQKISRAAVGDLAQAPEQIAYAAPGGSQEGHVDGLPLGTRGGFAVTHTFPLDATYELRVRARGPGALAGQRLCPPPRVAITIDGRPLAAETPQAFRLRVTAGPHTLTAALLDQQRCEGVNELFGVYAPSGAIDAIEIHGPFDATGTGDTPSRRAIFSCAPPNGEGETRCAREILTSLAARAYRRPVDTVDPALETLLRFYAQGRADGDFEAGIASAIARLLVDPEFLYRLEREPPGVVRGGTYRVSDVALASRLSFFLWSSLPDDALMAAAASGQLGQPATLERQVRRMLADPRAGALVENFAGQWLKLRELNDALPQDPGFDARLRSAFRRETELFVEHLLREDSSVLDLLGARYTFLDERLAKHYGIDGVVGSHFRRVELPATSPRGGLLGHGSILTATSVADRTSPVVRGAWLVENVLGAEVPPPPPGVEADLTPERAPAAAKTLRQRMEAHRSNPVCAACHELIDPFGFALEPFDLVGRWRVSDGGEPIDASARLTDGTPIDGPIDLRNALLERPDVFVTALTEKLLTYALGRILDAHDKPAVRKIVAEAARNGYRFSDVIVGIAKSLPFQMQTERTGTREEP